MQIGDAQAAARALWRDEALTAQQFRDAIGRLFGWDQALQTTKTARKPARHTAAAAVPKTPAARPRRRGATGAGGKLNDRIYAAIPETSGVARAELAKRLGEPPNQIGRAIKRLGARVVEQNGVLFRAEGERERQAARQAA